MELLVIIIVTLVLVPVFLLTSGWLGVVLGLPFVLFFPGYTMTAAIFPKKDGLDAMERIALSFGLSAAVIPLIGLILNYTPMGIHVSSVTVSIALFIVVTSTIAIWRRRSLPKEERFRMLPPVDLSHWRQQSALTKCLHVILLLSIVVTVGLLVYLVAFPKLGERFTEFYFTPERGKSSQLAAGDPLTATLRIVSHEHQDTSYHVEVRVDGVVVKQTAPFTLTHNEKRDESVAVVPANVGEHKVEFLLYRHGEEGVEIYRSLYLLVNVKGATS